MKRPLLRALAFFGLYLLVAVLVTWPLLANLSSVFAGFVYGDAYETAHHVWWFTEALRTGQSPFFQPLLAYPAGLEGVTLWADPLHFFPAWLFALAMPLPAAINLQTLLTLALNGLAMWAFARWLLRPHAHVVSAPTAIVGGAQRAAPATELHAPTPSPTGEGKQPTPAAVGAQRAAPDGPGTQNPLVQDVGARHALPLQTTDPAVLSKPADEEASGRALARPYSPLPEGEGPGVRAELAALLAGLVFMLYPAVQGHLGAGHTGLLVQWPLPLFAWAMLRLDRAAWRGILLAAGMFVLGALGHTLQALYALAPLAGLIALRFAWRREWRGLGRALLAVAMGAVLLALFGLPVFRATLGTSAYADEGGGVRYSADLLAVVTPSFFHPVFGQWEYTHRVLGINLDEGAAFVGFSGLLIALLALWKAPRSRFWWGVALVGWILSLGPLLKVFDQPVTIGADTYLSAIPLPFAAVADWPLVRLARTPGRFSFLLGFAWSVILAYGLFWLLGALSARFGERRARIAGWAIAVGLGVLIVFEFQTFWPLPTARADIPEAIAALGERDDVRGVLDVPWDNLVAAKEGLYLQTAHGLPLIAGHVTRRTPVSPALLTILEDTLDPARLREAGADLVIVHRQQEDGTLYARAVEQLGEPLFEDERFAVFEVPQTDAQAEALTAGVRGGAVADSAESYFYAPEAGWWSWAAQLEADGRDVSVSLDGQILQRLQAGEPATVFAPFPVTAGYHTLTLAVEPPCPDHPPEGQICRSVTVRNVALEALTGYVDAPSAVFRAPGETRESVRLQAALPETAAPGGTLRLPLVWTASTARSETDTRFVHVLDANGGLVAQQDGPLGVIPAGESRAEWVALALPPDLPPGDYRVVAGWYTQPDLVNFCALDGDTCAGNEASLGVVRVDG